jgi:hypothetical protein
MNATKDHPLFQLPKTKVAVDRLLHDHIADVAEAMGRSIEHVIDEALNRYVDEHGEPYLAYVWAKAPVPKGKRTATRKKPSKPSKHSKGSNLIAFPSS